MREASLKRSAVSKTDVMVYMPLRGHVVSLATASRIADAHEPYVLLHPQPLRAVTKAG